MNPSQLNPDTEALLQGYLEGTLTPEDSTRLLAALKSQPELVGVLLDGLWMDALIREVVSETEAESNVSSTTLPTERRSPIRRVGDGNFETRRVGDWRSTLRGVRAAGEHPTRRSLWNHPLVLALAASVLLFVGLAAWYFGPTVGLPELSEVQGLGTSIERGTEFIPAANKMALQLADILRLGTNASATIAFGAEQTRFELTAGTELNVTSLARGKHFVLQAGRIEATVAHQRPFHPMIIRTPQAEARVLGTKFSLLTTANATRLDVTQGQVRLTQTRDGAAVKVSAGYHTIAATNTELAVQFEQ